MGNNGFTKSPVATGRVYYLVKSYTVPCNCSSDTAPGRRNLILRFVVSSRSSRVTHSFNYGGAPYKCLYGGAHTDRRKSRRLAAVVGFGRVRGGQISSKITELPKKALPAVDLRGSAGPPGSHIGRRTVKSSCTGPRVVRMRGALHGYGTRSPRAKFC